MLRAVAIFALCLAVWSAHPAHATHESGARYELVGFSQTGEVLVRLTRIQFGVMKLEVLSLQDGHEVAVRSVNSERRHSAPERSMIERFGIHSIGLLGPVAPDRGAAVWWVPEPQHQSGDFEYTVKMLDGLGEEERAIIPVPTRCGALAGGGHARLETRWAPDGTAAVIAGAVVVEPACGAPTLIPVLVIVRTRSPRRASKRMLTDSLNTARQHLEHLSSQRPHEALSVAEQLLAFDPTDIDLLITVARLRTIRGDEGGAIAALWAAQRAHGPSGQTALGHAMSAPWSAALRHRAAYRALAWQVYAHPAPPARRAPEAPVAMPPDSEEGALHTDDTPIMSPFRALRGVAPGHPAPRLRPLLPPRSTPQSEP